MCTVSGGTEPTLEETVVYLLSVELEVSLQTLSKLLLFSDTWRTLVPSNVVPIITIRLLLSAKGFTRLCFLSIQPMTHFFWE